ncbi:MAG: AraC family transcriptional regulator [Deltaproteobacteria bacterium]|nr:AraC family transcriptional regulator [Deltaproteobacteria bacterium]MBW2535174.1 AraC family transcriptional regulator [Deltaproteobacteria bacterium]
MVQGLGARQALVDNAQNQLATACLDDTELSLTEIVFLLGFADQSEFNHAFRGWTGDTPLGYRQRPRQG